MKVVRTIVVAVLLLVFATGAAIWLNPGWLLNQGLNQFKQQTGRQINVAGNRSLKLGMTSTVRLEDVTIGPATGSSEPPLKAKAVELDFETLPLLARRLEAGQLRIESPEVVIEPAPASTRSAASTPVAKQRPPYAFREVVISNARVNLREAPGAAPVVVEAINLKTDRVVAGEPVAATFDLMFRGEKVSGTTRIAAPHELAEGGTSAVNIKLTTQRGSLDADGEAVLAGAPRFTGKGTALTRSLRDLASWLGQPLPEGKGFQAARASGDVTVDPKRLQLANARIVVDDTTATGNLNVDLPPQRLKVTGKLAADRLDAGRYVDAARQEPSTEIRRSRSPAFTMQMVPLKESLRSYLAATARGAQPEAAMLEAAGIDTRRAASTGDAWSDTPLFEADTMKALDADLDLSIKKVTVRGVDVGLPRLKVALNSGELMLDAPQIETGNGGLGAMVRVDARQAVPTLTSTIKLDELEVRDLLGEVGVESYVAGEVSGQGEFKAQGRSQREIVRSLDGTVKAVIPRGAVVGWDVWSVIKNWGRLGAFDEGKRVPLDRVNANVVVAKGIARTQAAEAGGPVLQLRAEATARLPSRDLDTQARVRLVSSILSGIAIKVGGPWDDLKLSWGWDSVFGSTRGDPVQSPVGVVDGLDLKDPELASLLRQAIERAKSTRAVNESAVESMTQLLEKAEGR